jgi:hypothetical protein
MKRGAEKQLTKDNFDNDEDAEVCAHMHSLHSRC